jgi:hypothetical protein
MCVLRWIAARPRRAEYKRTPQKRNSYQPTSCRTKDRGETFHPGPDAAHPV